MTLEELRGELAWVFSRHGAVEKGLYQDVLATIIKAGLVELAPEEYQTPPGNPYPRMFGRNRKTAKGVIYIDYANPAYFAYKESQNAMLTGYKTKDGGWIAWRAVILPKEEG